MIITPDTPRYASPYSYFIDKTSPCQLIKLNTSDIHFSTPHSMGAAIFKTNNFILVPEQKKKSAGAHYELLLSQLQKPRPGRPYLLTCIPTMLLGHGTIKFAPICQDDHIC